MKPKTVDGRLTKIEVLTQLNLVLLAGHIGIPLIPLVAAVIP